MQNNRVLSVPAGIRPTARADDAPTRDHVPDNAYTVECWHYADGVCVHGLRCLFAHRASPRSGDTSPFYARSPTAVLGAHEVLLWNVPFHTPDAVNAFLACNGVPTPVRTRVVKVLNGTGFRVVYATFASSAAAAAAARALNDGFVLGDTFVCKLAACAAAPRECAAAPRARAASPPRDEWPSLVAAPPAHERTAAELHCAKRALALAYQQIRALEARLEAYDHTDAIAQRVVEMVL